jgi:hypothetical protein
MSAVNSTGPSPQKLDMKDQSWSKICTNTLEQIDTFNYTVIYLYEVEKDLSMKVSPIKNWRHKHTIADFQIKRFTTDPLKKS